MLKVHKIQVNVINIKIVEKLEYDSVNCKWKKLRMK